LGRAGSSGTVSGPLDLAPKLFFRPVEGGPVIGSLSFGYQNLAPRHVEPKLGRLLDAIGIEDDGHLHRAGGQVPQALHNRDRAFPQCVRYFAVANGDGRLHELLLPAQPTAEPSMMSFK
jgi:hypothetical protein